MRIRSSERWPVVSTSAVLGESNTMYWTRCCCRRLPSLVTRTPIGAMSLLSPIDARSSETGTMRIVRSAESTSAMNGNDSAKSTRT
jgi:hypothetical protein